MRVAEKNEDKILDPTQNLQEDCEITKLRKTMKEEAIK